MTKHTQGRWTRSKHSRTAILCGDFIVAAPFTNGRDGPTLPVAEQEANAQLIAAAPNMLAWLENEYAVHADPRNEWAGRNTPAGQKRLATLRDLIAEATGREAQEVQDEYSNRALAGDAS